MRFSVAVLVGIFCVLLSSLVKGQDLQDSTEMLDQVVVKAYDNYRKLVDVPAAISVINKSQIARFNNTSLVNVMNTNPGVRMEERSPGSYRLNIRGSSLRSPFGVRNIKVYYNDIPYTDPGGNTFLNQLGLFNIGRIEVIKGPGGSLYGAGTGGVILINNDLDNIERGGTVEYSGGSFGTNSFHANLRGGEQGKLFNSFHHQYQSSNGYRNHTAMERRMTSWDGVAKVGEKGTLRAHFMQGNLSYETPGALTATEYNNDPKAARPGAEAAHASINQKLFLAGLNYSIKWNKYFESSTSMYGSFSRLVNPTLRNYERRTEPHFGTRNVISFRDSIGKSLLILHGGVEFQQSAGSTKVYDNNNGTAGAPQTDDEVTNKTHSVFIQAMFEMPKDWMLTGGASFNLINVEILRLSAPSSLQKRNYNNEVAPRLAILKKLKPSLSVYGSVSKGFSPPTTAEILPSTGIINTALEAEDGINYEVGTKGNFLKGRLYFDINTFYFQLKNTIAQRRDENGADYFVNAGSTRQFGLETFVSYRLPGNNFLVFDQASLWLSHTWNNFRYNNFQKVGEAAEDFSGKKLPGIPSQFISAGADFSLRKKLCLNITYFYSDPLALNDANTDYASSYNLLDARISYRRGLFKNAFMEIFAAANNIFNVKYSLGNDINAFGGRYYNAAPGANFTGGITLKYNW